jgi:hypothetical protein
MAKFVLVAMSDNSLDPSRPVPVTHLADETGLNADQVVAAVDLLYLEGVLPAPPEVWDPNWGSKPGPKSLNRKVLYPLLVQRDGDHCQECCAVELGNLHIDHVMPRALGGDDELGNLQLLCRRCNVRKKDKHPDVWRAGVAAAKAAATHV